MQLLKEKKMCPYIKLGTGEWASFNWSLLSDTHMFWLLIILTFNFFHPEIPGLYYLTTLSPALQHCVWVALLGHSLLLVLFIRLPPHFLIRPQVPTPITEN